MMTYDVRGVALISMVVTLGACDKTSRVYDSESENSGGTAGQSENPSGGSGGVTTKTSNTGGRETNGTGGTHSGSQSSPRGGNGGTTDTSVLGGASNQGGTSNIGGSSNVATLGGASSTGGKSGTGGTSNLGGTSSTGGTSNPGGTSSIGGTTSATTTTAPCTGSTRDLRIVTLHLGNIDYITLRNTGTCAVSLKNVNVIFDDRDDAFSVSDGVIDCTVALPDVSLGAGATIRVSENGLPGDISALNYKVVGCDKGVPFNPQRGGSTYVCVGTCATGSVIDVVAHQGYNSTWAAPQAARFGVTTFASPLAGLTDANQDSAHFKRIAFAGTATQYVAADWKLVNRTFFADFEDSATLSTWTNEPGQTASISISADTYANGATSLRIIHQGTQDGLSQTLTRTFAGGSDLPVDISYFVNTTATGKSTGFFDTYWQSATNVWQHAIQGSFKSSGLGVERANNERAQVTFAANTWYQVEFRDIDWSQRKFDLYINRQLVASRFSFWTNALNVGKLSLYAVSSGSTVYFDDIEFWQ
jgi:hypothetical protein